MNEINSEDWMDELTKQGFVKTVDKPAVDVDGNPYRERKFVGYGHVLEINEDEYGFHGRADGNNRTTRANMDKGGLIAWLQSLFEF